MQYLAEGQYLHSNCYRILKLIGQGGFGITYLAEEVGYLKSTGFGEKFVSVLSPEKVVIKELYFEDICSRDSSTGLVTVTSYEKREQFEKLVNKQLEEGKTLNELNHKNIVKTRNIFKENDTAYMVIEYVEGSNCEEIIKSAGSLNKDEAINYIIQILEAVSYIHDKRILHLDIKPSNILIRKDTTEAVLIDFGAALAYGENDRVSSTTSKLITGISKNYAPSEQADIDNLKEFDATFDTYAIGATLYHMLTGTPPPLSSLVSTGRIKVKPPSIIANSKDISDFLDIVVLKAINPRYPDRYGSARALADALKNEDNYNKLLDAVDELIRMSRYDDALEQLSGIKKLFTETPRVLRAKKLCQQAISTIKKNIETNLNDRPILVGSKETGTQNVALPKTEVVIKSPTETFVKQGLQAMNAGNYLEAITLFENGLASNVEKLEAKTLKKYIAECKQKIFKATAETEVLQNNKIDSKHTKREQGIIIKTKNNEDYDTTTKKNKKKTPLKKLAEVEVKPNLKRDLPSEKINKKQLEEDDIDDEFKDLGFFREPHEEDVDEDDFELDSDFDNDDRLIKEKEKTSVKKVVNEFAARSSFARATENIADTIENYIWPVLKWVGNVALVIGFFLLVGYWDEIKRWELKREYKNHHYYTYTFLRRLNDSEDLVRNSKNDQVTISATGKVKAFRKYNLLDELLHPDTDEQKSLLNKQIGKLTKDTISALDTIFFNQNWVRAGKKNAAYFRIATPASDTSYNITDYYLNGHKQMEGTTTQPFEDGLKEPYPGRNGKFVFYTKTGSISSIRWYRNGYSEGSYASYYPNGDLFCKGNYFRGKMTGKWIYYGSGRHVDSTFNYVFGTKTK